MGGVERICVRFDNRVGEDIKQFYRKTLSSYAEVDEVMDGDLRSKTFIFGPDAGKVLFDPISLLQLDKNVRIYSYEAEDDATAQEDILFAAQNTAADTSPLLCALSFKEHCIINYDKRSCLFLDRDGTIIQDTGYPSGPEAPALLDTIIPVMAHANSRGVPVVVATNQSGIGRGYFSEEDFSKYTDRIVEALARRGCHIDYWHFCPFHEDALSPRYKRKSPARKPSPGMVLQTFRYFPVDVCRSVMIGDRESDRINLPGLESLIVPRNLDGIRPEEILTHLEKRGL